MTDKPKVFLYLFLLWILYGYPSLSVIKKYKIDLKQSNINGYRCMTDKISDKKYDG